MASLLLSSYLSRAYKDLLEVITCSVAVLGQKTTTKTYTIYIEIDHKKGPPCHQTACAIICSMADMIRVGEYPNTCNSIT